MLFSRCLLCIALLCTTFLLNGCGFLFGDDGMFPDKSSDYLRATESDSIVVPDELKAALPEDRYAIPNLEFSSVLPKKYEVPRVDSLDNIESKGTNFVNRLFR